MPGSWQKCLSNVGLGSALGSLGNASSSPEKCLTSSGSEGFFLLGTQLGCCRVFPTLAHLAITDPAN